MSKPDFSIFSRDQLDSLFPPSRANDFFDALLGDAAEGAYDIQLEYIDASDDQTLNFELHLKQRPGKCLACNLTYGLPEVFSRHPVINIAGVAAEVANLLGRDATSIQWKLGTTRSNSRALHSIPLTITIQP